MENSPKLFLFILNTIKIQYIGGFSMDCCVSSPVFYGVFYGVFCGDFFGGIRLEGADILMKPSGGPPKLPLPTTRV